MKEINYNPDVLTCLANLSNDEVFTPPTIVNQMLDTLPKELWHNSKAKFLDPFTKSGVFLREIVKRLNTGLEKEIPNLQDRINHILKNQVYGIAITELTALLTRRSLYCSKYANGKKSITNIFKNEDGNIAYERIEHTWENGKCKYCGASESIYDREKELESHAYIFIHNKNPFKNMQFDVIIGNPPYQLNDGGGTGSSAKPIYHLFVQQAIKLNPRYLTMIIPARWYTGGKGLDKFRDDILNDNRISELHDFPESKDCFDGVLIEGGITYFLWNRDKKGICKVVTHSQNLITSICERPLLEKDSDVFIRNNNVIPILKKINIDKKGRFSEIVSSRNPYGLGSNFFDLHKLETNKGLKSLGLVVLGIENNSRTEKIIPYDFQIPKGENDINKWKLFVSKADGAAGQIGNPIPARIIGKAEIGKPGSICTETFLQIGPFKSKKEALSVNDYMKTKFFRFVVGARKSKNMTKDTYSFVPMQDFNEEWNDEKLYKKYGLSQEEIDFIESMIKPME